MTELDVTRCLIDAYIVDRSRTIHRAPIGTQYEATEGVGGDGLMRRMGAG